MKQWSALPSETELQSAVENLEARGFSVVVVDTRKDALAKLRELIPAGETVMTGSSTTLTEVGFNELLDCNESPWKSMHAQIQAEDDAAKREHKRRQSVSAPYYVASVNAIAHSGELIAVDATGSRVGAYPFAAEHLILVAGTQKIAHSLDEAMKRVREYVFPLEDKRAHAAYGMHSSLSKWVIIEREFTPGRIQLILVREALGF